MTQERDVRAANTWYSLLVENESERSEASSTGETEQTAAGAQRVLTGETVEVCDTTQEAAPESVPEEPITLEYTHKVRVQKMRDERARANARIVRDWGLQRSK